MTRIFDAAGAKCPPQDGGISPLDLADLPADQKKIMLTLLRDQGKSPDGITADILRKAVGNEVENFDETIATLQKDGWLTLSGDEPNIRFRIAFRPRRAKQTAFSLWSVLSDRTSTP